MKKSVLTFRNAKQKNERLTMLTAYDYSTAKLIDASGIDSVLVGDSLGMVMLGYEDTLSVTMEDMIHHTKAVERLAGLCGGGTGEPSRRDAQGKHQGTSVHVPELTRSPRRSARSSVPFAD